MKLTNQQILESIQSIRELQNRKLPSKMTYAVMKNTKTLQDALDTFNDTRRKIIEDHAEHRIQREDVPEGELEDGEEAPAKTDENGDFIPQRDREGNILIKQDEKGSPIWRSEGDSEEASKAISDVIDEEVEVDIHKFNFNDLPNDIEPGILLPIDFMIKED